MRMHVEMITAKNFGAFICVYFFFKIERLSTNIKLTLHLSPH
jgi:hypothetical protein